MKAETRIKTGADIAMTVLILLLMAVQVTGDLLHEWIGIGETVLVIVHQILNRRWYGALFKGKYKAYRIISTAVAVLLLVAFLLAAFSGMSMSAYAVPFLYGMAPVMLMMKMHLSASNWAFLLTGIHLGLHLPSIVGRLKMSARTKKVAAGILTAIGLCGLFLYVKNGMARYLLFREHFAALDSEKHWAIVLLENIAMLGFFVSVGMYAAITSRKKNEQMF